MKRKYSVWYDNGTGYYELACTTRASSKPEAISEAHALFPALTGLIATVGVEDPNKPYPDNTQTERNQRKYQLRKERNRRITQLRQVAGNSVVKLATSLPCAVFADNATGLCGKPAYAAYCEPHDDPFVPGRWLVQPVCEECAIKSAQNYEKN